MNFQEEFTFTKMLIDNVNNNRDQTYKELGIVASGMLEVVKTMEENDFDNRSGRDAIDYIYSYIMNIAMLIKVYNDEKADESNGR